MTLGEHPWTAAPELRLIGGAAASSLGALLSAYWFGALGIILAGVGVVFTAGAFIHWRVQHGRHCRDRVITREDGIELQTRGEDRFIEWSAIDSVVAIRAREHVASGRHGFWGVTSASDRPPRWCFVVRSDGETVLTVDDHWRDFDSLARTIDGRVRALLVPAMRAKLTAGEALRFGAIELSTEGIRYADRLLGWNDLRGVRIEQGQVVIERKPVGRFATPDVRTVDNVTTLIDLTRWAPAALTKETYRGIVTDNVP